MSDRKSVLLIGLEPSLIDFSSPDFADFPGLNAGKVLAGLNAARDSLSQLGYQVQLCLTDYGETAEIAVRNMLEEKRYDCILIGAGVRAVPGNLLLFEKLINVVHAGAPQAKLCFNTEPTDTVEAVRRWL
jgi:DNA-binding LacI/PurR family transcriptional regulator